MKRSAYTKASPSAQAFVFEKKEVRRSGHCCSSLTELMRKARAAGDGYFYLPLHNWPADTEQIPLREKWVVISSLSQDGFPL